MFSRYWLPGLALIGIAVFGLGAWWLYEWDNERERTYQATHKEYEDSKGRLPPGVTIREQSSQPEPKSYREEWRSERDLEAQREMSEWAFFMLIVSGVSVVVTAVGVVYVALTLRATRDAVGEAERGTSAALSAAEAGIEANRIASKLGQTQVRAYMSAYDSKTGVNRSRVPIVEFMLKNSGQSPARNLSIKIELKAFDDATSGKPFHHVVESQVVGDFAAGDERPFRHAFATAATIDPVTRDAFDKADFYLATICVSFFDIFKCECVDRYHTSIRCHVPSGRQLEHLVRVEMLLSLNSEGEQDAK